MVCKWFYSGLNSWRPFLCCVLLNLCIIVSNFSFLHIYVSAGCGQKVIIVLQEESF